MAERVENIFTVKVSSAAEGYTLEATSKNERLVARGFAWGPTAEEECVLSEIKEGKASSSEIIKLGQTLYDAIFLPGSDIRKAFEQAHSGSTEGSIRLCLQIQPPELNKWPWEAMHDGRDFVAMQARTPMVRTVQDRPARNRHAIQGALNVLFVGASPADCRPVDQEIRHTENLLRKLIDEKQPRPGILSRRVRRVQMDASLLNASFEGLKSRLFSKRYHILCFAGHGDARAIFMDDGTNGEQAGNAHKVSAEALAQLLEPTDIRLVFLLACETASLEDLGSVARHLASQAKIPAVVAMQTKVGTGMAERLARDFFRALADFSPVDIALAKARKSLMSTSTNLVSRDTIAPLLYLQTPSSELFRRAFNWLKWGLVWVSVAAVLIVLIQSVSNWINTTRQQIREEFRVSQQIETRLQVVGQLSRIEEADTGRNPQPILLAGGDIWVSSVGGNTVQRFSLTGVRIAEIVTGTEPHRPVTDGTYLWVSNRGDSTLTRIDPASDKASFTVPVGTTPERPLVAGKAIWVQSFVDGTLTRVDRESGAVTTVTTDFNAQPAFAGGDYVWVITNKTNRLTRIDAATRQERTFTFGQRIASGTYAMGYVWLIVDERSILQIEPGTGNVVKTLDPGFTSALPIIAQGALWLYEASGSRIVQIDPQRGIKMSFDAGAQPRRLFHTPNRLWVVTDNNTLVAFDITTGARLNIIDIPGLSQRSFSTSDGNRLWLTSTAGNTVVIIDQGSATESHRFSPCKQPLGPVYDGVNMWFSCVGENRLLRLPAVMYYFGARNQGVDTYTHVPITIDNRLWLAQESSGQIVVYEGATNSRPSMTVSYDGGTATRTNVITLSAPLIPPVKDDPYIWTAATLQGKLIRLTPRMGVGDLLGIIPPSLEVAVESVSVVGEINSIHLIGEHIWVLHSKISDLQDSPNVTIFNRKTLACVAVHRLGVAPTGLAWIGDDVWIGASMMSQGKVYRLDAKTGAIRQSYNLPGTAFAPWGPARVNGRLWFTAGAPPLDRAGRFMLEMFDFVEGQEHRVRSLYTFDTTTDQWRQVYEILPAPSRPLVDDPYLWFVSNRRPVVVRETDDNDGTIFVIDTRDGSLRGPWNPCVNTIGPYNAGQFIWIGCRAPDTAMWVFDRSTLNIVYRYASVGSRPSVPVESGNYVWFTYRDTNSAAVFERATGKLVRVFAVGVAPSAPFLYNEQIWVYNTGDGTMQRLDLNLSAETTETE